MTEPERDGVRKPDIDDREALLDEREAVLDALQQLLGQPDAGHSAVRAEAEQARLQAQQLRARSRQVREAARRGAANAASSRVPWRGQYPLGAESAALTDQMLASADPHEVIHHVEQTATRLIPGAAVASVMILDAEDRFHTSVGSDPLALRLGEAQHRAGEGPCHDATRPHSPKLARCDDLAADTRWPRFSPAAVGLGVRSVVAVGLLPLSPTRLGALHVYGRDPYALTDADVEVVGVLASHLAVALLVLAQLDQTQGQLDQLRHALGTRDVIGQAKGIVMNQRHISADEAFALLSATSQRLNLKLRDLAERVVRAGHL